MQLDLLMPAPLAMVNANIDRFPAAFLAYLPENLPVYAAFEREAKCLRRELGSATA
jgi:hypothetical protein